MNGITRREFLSLSAATAAGLYLAGCQPLQPPAPPAPASALPTLPAPTPAEVNLLPADVQTTVENVVGFMMDDSHTPGLAVGIVQDGQPIYAQGFGVATAGGDQPVTAQSIFQVMDMTHVFTAAAAMQLVEQGKLDLDEPVVEVLPYFQLDDERYKQITMRHLLTESAGLPEMDWFNSAADWQGKTPQTDDGALERYVRSLGDVQLWHDPGQRPDFCNMSYDIAGDVIAKISGQLFEDYMAQHVLQPLGMVQSTFYPQQVNADLLVTPHVLEAVKPVPSELVTYSRERAPSVGLFSSLGDLLRWTQANLNRGELDGQRILQAATYDLLWAPFQVYSALYRTSDFDSKAIGWILGSLGSHPMCQYLGMDLGFNGAFCLVPERRSGAVVLINLFSSFDTTAAIALSLAEMLLDMTALKEA